MLKVLDFVLFFKETLFFTTNLKKNNVQYREKTGFKRQIVLGRYGQWLEEQMFFTFLLLMHTTIQKKNNS